MDLGPFEHFIDPELIRGVESRMLGYTKINPPMEIRAAADKTIFGTAQGILLFLARDTQDLCRTVKLPIALVPGLNINICSSIVGAAQKGVKTVITKAGSVLALGLLLIQLRWDDLDHLDLALAKESKRTEPVCWAVSGKTFGNKTVLIAPIPQKLIALSTDSIKIDQRALENDPEGYNSDSPTYRIHDPTSTRRVKKLTVARKITLSRLHG